MTSIRLHLPAGRLIRFLSVISCFMIPASLFSQNFTWAKQLGGTNASATQSMGAILFDAAGNSYHSVACTGMVDVDPGPGTLNFTSTTALVKLDAAGNLLWAKQIDGRLALDAAGFIYTSGNFTGTKDFDPGAGVANLSSFGYDDVFVAKYDANGNFVWAKQVGGAYRELSWGLAVSPQGTLYITGSFGYGGNVSPINSCDFDPDPAVVYNLTNVGNSDGFILSLDNNGSFISVVQKGTSYADAVGAIGTDAAGNIYYHASSNLNSYLEKVNSAFEVQWTSDVVEMQFAPMCVDASGNLYLSGGHSGTADFDPGPGVTTLTASTVQDPVVMKYDANGNFQWAKIIKANGFANGVVSDANGNVYTSGYFNAKGNVDFDPGSGQFNLKVNDVSTYVQKLSGNGDFVWAVKIGGDAKTKSRGRAIGLGVGNQVVLAFEIVGRVDVNPGTATNYFTAKGNQDLVIASLSQGTARSADVGVEETINVKEIAVSPNPTPGKFVLSIPTFTSAANVIVYDAAGKLVMSRKLPAGSPNNIAIDDIRRAGVYSVVVHGDGKVYNTRVVIN